MRCQRHDPETEGHLGRCAPFMDLDLCKSQKRFGFLVLGMMTEDELCSGFFSRHRRLEYGRLYSLFPSFLPTLVP
jgi:hypothetical protein